jgi:hypothetical protein
MARALLVAGDKAGNWTRWRRRDDPGIDDPGRRAAARNAREVGYYLAQMCKQRGLTQAQVARVMNVSQARVSKMEHPSAPAGRTGNRFGRPGVRGAPGRERACLGC